MGKIILASIGLILIVLGVNAYWPFAPSLTGLRVNPSDGQRLIQDFKTAVKSLPQRLGEGAGGAVKGVQTSVASYLMKKTGGEITGVLKSLPSEQQKEIQKEYCGK